MPTIDRNEKKKKPANFFAENWRISPNMVTVHNIDTWPIVSK
jgi:hypothetical protein